MLFPVLISLFFSGLGHSQDLKDVSDILQAPVAPKVQCTPETLDQNILKECALKLCGKPGSLPSIISSGNELKDYRPSPEEKAEIERSMGLIKSALDSWKSTAQYEMKNFKANLDLNPDLVHPSTQSLERTLSSYVQYRVEGSKIRILPDFPKDINPKLKAGLQEWIAGKEKEVQTDPMLRLRLGLDTTSEALEKLNLKFQDFKKLVSSLPDTNKDKISVQGTYPAIETALADSSEVSVSNISSFLQFATAAITPVPEVKHLKANLHEPACKSKCLEGLKTIFNKDSLDETLVKLSVRMAKDEAPFLESCRTGLELQAKFGQLPEQRKKALSLVDKALDKVTALPWWSSHTKGAFRDFIHQKAKVAESFASKDVISYENIVGQGQLEMGKFSPNGIVDNLIGLRQYPGNIYGKAVPFCPSAQEVVTDSFQYNIEKPLLHISSYSCEHQGTGEGIVAHELGHGLSAFMKLSGEKSPESAKTYQKIRSCVSSSNPLVSLDVPDNALLPFLNDRLTTEEDTADWLLNKSVKTQVPIGCAILYVMDDEYYNLDLRAMPGDTHSSSLLRALRQVHMQTGSLPSVCQEALAAYKGIVEVKSCDF